MLFDKIQRSIQNNTITFNKRKDLLQEDSSGVAGRLIDDFDHILVLDCVCVVGSPNCVILDEIDGIDNKDTVDMILKIVKQPLNAARTQASKNDIPLTRPLICICNDQFAPQLRELRQHAQVFVFAPPSQTRLVNRLKQIISLEGAQLSSSVLMMLCNSNGSYVYP